MDGICYIFIHYHPINIIWNVAKISGPRYESEGWLITLVYHTENASVVVIPAIHGRREGEGTL